MAKQNGCRGSISQTSAMAAISVTVQQGTHAGPLHSRLDGPLHSQLDTAPLHAGGAACEPHVHTRVGPTNNPKMPGQPTDQAPAQLAERPSAQPAETSTSRLAWASLQSAQAGALHALTARVDYSD